MRETPPGSCQWTQLLFLPHYVSQARVAEEVPTVFTLKDFIAVFAGPRLTTLWMGSSEELRLMYPRGGIEAGWVGGVGGNARGSYLALEAVVLPLEARAATRRAKRAWITNLLILNIGLLVWLLISCNTDLLFLSEILALLPRHPQEHRLSLGGLE